MANYPASNPSFTPIVDGVDYPQADDLQGVYDEVTAIGTQLREGLQHAVLPDATANNRDLGSTTQKFRAVHLSGAMNAASAALTTPLPVASGGTAAATATANTVFAGPTTGAAAAPAFRALVVADISGIVAPLISVDDTQVTTSTGSETALRTYSVPANTLDTNGTTIRLTGVGTLAADGDAKQIRVRWGGMSGTVCADITQNSAALTHWRVDVLITRLGSNSQRLSGRAEYGAANTGATNASFTLTTAAETDTAGIDLVITGQGINASDIVYEASWVELLSP